MQRKPKNLRAKTRGISMYDDTYNWCMGRATKLGPYVGFTGYIRKLVEADREMDVLGLNKKAA